MFYVPFKTLTLGVFTTKMLLKTLTFITTRLLKL